MMNYHAAKKGDLSIEYFGDIDQFHIENISFRQRIVLNLEDWDVFSGLVEKMNEYIHSPEEDKIPDLSGLDPKETKDLIESVVELTAKNVLSTFVALGLKTHIDVKVVNDFNGNEFRLLFTKIQPKEDPVFDPQDLKHGVYRIYWKDGGSSVASVGSTSDGTRWYQPSNWISEEVCTSWSRVERVELIETQNPPSDGRV
jgi:hypothetical protein